MPRWKSFTPEGRQWHSLYKRATLSGSQGAFGGQELSGLERMSSEAGTGVPRGGVGPGGRLWPASLWA